MSRSLVLHLRTEIESWHLDSVFKDEQRVYQRNLSYTCGPVSWLKLLLLVHWVAHIDLLQSYLQCTWTMSSVQAGGEGICSASHENS